MKITTARIDHGYETGNVVSITKPDTRKLMRFWHWVTFRKRPTITETFKVTSTTSTTFDMLP